MEDIYRFAEGESLLCYHRQILYEAKCLKRRKTSDNTLQYFVHYKGWKSKWDEWLDESQIEPVNEENLEKMASLKKKFIPKKKRAYHRITVVKEKTICNPNTKNEVDSKTLLEINTNFNVSSPKKPKQETPVRRNNIPIASKIEPPEGIYLQDHNSMSVKKRMYKRRQPIENSLIPNKQVCQNPKTLITAKIKPTKGTNLQMRNSELLVQKRVSNLNKHTGISIKPEYQGPKTLIAPKIEPTEKRNTQGSSSNGEKFSGKNRVIATNTANLNNHIMVKKIPLKSIKGEVNHSVTIIKINTIYKSKHTAKVSSTKLNSELNKKAIISPTRGSNFKIKGQDNSSHIVPKIEQTENIDLQDHNSPIQKEGVSKQNKCLGMSSKKTMNIQSIRKPNSNKQGQITSINNTSTIETIPEIIDLTQPETEETSAHSSKQFSLRKPKSNGRGQITSINNTSTIETIPEIIDLTQQETEEKCVQSSKKFSTDTIVLNIIVNDSN